MKKSCKECPWKTKSKHSQAWPGYVKSVESIGQIKDKEHACHMLTNDVWGYINPITNENVCIGAKNFMNKKQ